MKTYIEQVAEAVRDAVSTAVMEAMERQGKRVSMLSFECDLPAIIASVPVPDPVAWFCVNDVTGRMIYTSDAQSMVEMRDEKKSRWKITALYATPQPPAEPVNKQLLSALGWIIYSGDAASSSIARGAIFNAAEQQAQPEPLTEDLPVSTLQRSISAASWATTKCFVTSPETDELPQLLIQAYCGNKEVNKAVARRVSAALNYCKGMNTAWLERAILAAAEAKRGV